ncbi:ATP-binding protein [Sphaerisporangium sp. NPDC049002]|uniref:ATP-binding protein n=1 Tax=unclassified Sphaerisporangium TaxID=2630420 RepID=UPI0033DD4981
MPIFHAFRNADDLTAEDCGLLLVEETAGKVLEEAVSLRIALQIMAPLPRSLVDLTLVAVMQRDLPLSPLALGMLAGSGREVGGEAGSVVQTLWDQVRAGAFGLPTAPAGVDVLCDVATALAQRNAVPEGEMTGEAAMATEEEYAPMGEHQHDDEPPQVGLRRSLELLDHLYLEAWEAAGRLRGVLHERRRPTGADVDRIVRVVHEFDEIHDQIQSLEDVEVAATSLDELSRALDQAEAAQATVERVSLLIHVHGPSVLDEQLAEVRKAAAEGPTDGLDALARLIQLSSEDPDAVLILADELEERAKKELPARWNPVIRAAVSGRLGMDVPVARPPSTIHAADTGHSSHGDEADGDAEGEDEGGTPPPLDAGPDSTPPTGESLMEADAEEDLHLTDLDLMLADRFGSRSTAHPVEPRQAPTERAAVPEAILEEALQAPPAEPVAAPEVSPCAAFAEAEAAALGAQRFGLAAWIRKAAGRPVAEIAARRCAALAVDMSSFAGRLSAAFTETSRKITTAGMADDPAGRLLAWAASIRAGLVHPTVESARLVDELASTVMGRQALTACGAAFSQALRSGVYLVPGLSGQMRDVARAERAQAHAVAACANLLEDGPHRRIKYPLATEVWKSLIQPEGAVGELVGVAARDDIGQLQETVRKLDELREAGVVDRLIDGEAKRSRTTRNTKIIAGARAKLVEMIDEALENVANWATAVREVQARRPSGSDEWLARGLAELRQAIGRHRSELHSELEALCVDADPVLAAAATGATHLINDTLHLLDGEALGEAEPSVAAVLNQDLLFAPEILLDADGLRPHGDPASQTLAQIAMADVLDWRGAFDARASRLDHEGTRAVADVVSHQDPDLGNELRHRRDTLVAEAGERRNKAVEEVLDRLAGWRKDGVLSETDATRIASGLKTLQRSEREDFGVVAEKISLLESEAASIRAGRIADEERLLTQKSKDHPDVRAAASRIREHLAVGDLTTAREFLQQAEAGRPLPAVHKTVDHFGLFFPRFPEAFESMSLLSSGGRARKQESDEWVTKLKEAIQSGREVTDPDLHRVMSEAGLSVQAMPPGRREESKEGLRYWKSLAQSPKAPSNRGVAIQAVLRTIGLEGRLVPAGEGQDRLWVTLNDVRYGDALLPEFGSKMSPSGGSMRLLFVWRRPGPQQLMEWLKDEPQDRTILVFYFGVLSPAQREQLTMAGRRRPRPVTAVIDDAAISYLAALPEAGWTATVSLLAPFSAANPYAPTGDVPMEMFYGRSSQLSSVISASGSSIVYGGRQLGKSALLREAARTLRRSDPGRVVILETIQEIGKIVPESMLWLRLAPRLAEAGVLPQSGATLKDRAEICQAVKQWADQDSARQLLILLDEADAFLNRDAANAKFANVEALRDLMQDTDGRVKVVFAGLHQTARFQSLSNQPFPHLGAPIPIGPLDPQDAFDLLTRPLMALGFRFPPTLAARVIAEANNAPALIQLFAAALLQRLRHIPIQGGGLPYEITSDDLAAVWRDRALEVGFRDRFEWTLDLDKRYKVIAYVVAFHALAYGTDKTVSIQELRDECLIWWAAGFENCTSDGFRGLLEECVNLGVLSSDADGYRLRTPHVLTLLGGAEEVDTVLSRANEFEQPDSFDAYAYRALYRNGPDLSPLTGAQVSRLFECRDSLHLITGSAALHIERVGLALEEAGRQHIAHVRRVQSNKGTFEGAVQRSRDGGGHNVVVVDLAGRSAEQATEIIKTATAAVSTGGAGTLAVALVAPPELVPVWLAVASGAEEPARRVWHMELRRYDQPVVRQWMDDAGLGYRDAAGQEALLKATGGWPLLVSKLVERPFSDREQALEGCRAWIRENAEEFVRSTGVLRDPTLWQAWRHLIDVGPDRPDDLATYLEMAGEEPSGPLHRDRLEAIGYPSWVALVEVLRSLGALDLRADGTLACEPVLAAVSERLEAGS